MIFPYTGILLINTGTPDAPTPWAVWRYLRVFLSDKHIVPLSRWLWWPLLYGIILPIRSFYSARLYQKIWTEEAPLRKNMTVLADKLQKSLGNSYIVTIGMNYGKPSIQYALKKFQKNNVTRILVLPLYPQYSQTTTAVSIDSVINTIRQWKTQPQLQIIQEYADHPGYIEAISQQIQETWKIQGRIPYLLFSFHGLPLQHVTRGDLYPKQCHQTAKKVAQYLNLTEDRWSVSFQSRIGVAQWVQPYTQEILQALPAQGIQDVDVICPGFSVDCLETLEEINIRYRAQFLKVGGKNFHYIPALNDTEPQIQMLIRIIQSAF